MGEEKGRNRASTTFIVRNWESSRKDSESVYRDTILPTRVETSKAGRIAACCQPFNHLADECSLPDTLNEGMRNHGVHAMDAGGNGVSEHSCGRLR